MSDHYIPDDDQPEKPDDVDYEDFDDVTLWGDTGPFEPIDLDVPPAGLLRPPQILPNPGPALEGTHELPRWGDELPPLAVPEEETPNKKKNKGPAGNK